MPEWLALSMADGLGRLALLWARRRRVGEDHLAQALPDMSAADRRRMLRRSCGQFARSAVESLVLRPRWGTARFLDRIEASPELVRSVDSLKGEPVIMVTGHLGAFEFCASWLHTQGFAIGVPAKEPHNWYVARSLARARARAGFETVPRRGALASMLRRLKAKQMAAFAVDQNQHRRPAFVPWFGRLAATERAPASIALRTGAAVLFLTCVRRAGGRYSLDGQILRPVGDPQTKATPEQLDALLLSINRALEAAILQNPEQYLWIHDRYRTRPENAP